MRVIASIIILLCIAACNGNKEEKKVASAAAVCDSSCEARSSNKELSCKLSSPELKKRKETVLASLKKKILDKKELSNGFAFKFDGSDENLDELTEFIKTERTCCDFFTFNLSVSGDKKEIWLELKGIDGAKDFVRDEMGL